MWFITLYWNKRIVKAYARTGVVISMVVLCGVMGSVANAQRSDQVVALYDQVGRLLPDSVVKAEQVAEKALSLALATKIGSDSLIARSYYLLGVVQIYRAKYYMSEKYFRQALNTEYAAQHTQIREACLNNLGVIYDHQDRTKEALEAYFASLRIAESRKDSFSIAQSWINIALIEEKSKDYKRGIDLASKALAYFSNYKDTLNMALCNQNLGVLYGLEKDFTRELSYFYESLRLFRAIGSQYYIVDVLSGLGAIQFRLGNPQKALEYFAEAESIAKANQFDEVPILVHKGELLVKSPGMLDRAEASLKKAQSLCAANGQREFLEQIYRGLAEIYAKRGDIPALQEAFDSLSEVQATRMQEATISIYEEIQAAYEIDKLRQENIILDQSSRLYRTQFWIATILVVSLLALLVYLFFFFRQKSRINALELRQATLERELRETELETERKVNQAKEQVIAQQKQQLAITAVQQINLKEQLQSIVSDLKQEHDVDLTAKLTDIEQNHLWTDFMDKFNLINPTFISSLSKLFPELNHSELIFCALVKLNLSFKEIANLLHIAHRSVHIKKYRISKKMALQEEDFYKVILAIE